MTPRGPLLLAAAALAGACATPPDRLEEAARAPAPGVREAFRDAAPAVLPDPSAALVEGTLRRAGEKGLLFVESYLAQHRKVHDDAPPVEQES